ncbi:multiple sugar transport system permease protein [Streptomyces achromogenes]|uniref:carbohydrate ABC transporter permease n=1 Tax=Streptomyces achromogenes TaxID=67255 RepID=UPI002784957B|nr:sugar ABC transporter permease [Streptomyces achromogenes]MDQ0834579.1 multiple sugar transport system permease protein [Streptomyces achromogenes]
MIDNISPTKTFPGGDGSRRHPAESPPSSTAGHRRGRGRIRATLEAYLLLAPSLAGLLMFLVAPIVGVVVISFFDWNLMGTPRFVGLANYREMMGDSEVWRAMRNTVYYVLLNIPAQTVLALLLALAMNRKLRGLKVLRVLFVLPWMAMPVALGIVWSWAFDPQRGVVNQFLALFGVDGPAWLSSTGWAMPVLASVNIWQYTGYTMLFLLAGLQAIPESLYEAADLDGAGTVQRFFRITLPLLRPSMFFVLVTNTIGSFQMFDTVYVMTQGGPGGSTDTMNYHIYQQAFQLFRTGYASALAMLLFAVILLVTAVQLLYFRKRTIYDFS